MKQKIIILISLVILVCSPLVGHCYDKAEIAYDGAFATTSLDTLFTIVKLLKHEETFSAAAQFMIYAVATKQVIDISRGHQVDIIQEYPNNCYKVHPEGCKYVLYTMGDFLKKKEN